MTGPLALLGGLAITSLLFALTAPTLLRLYWRLFTWPFRQISEFAYGFRHHEEVLHELDVKAALRRLRADQEARQIMGLDRT
jgi:hypothetical protein